MGKTDKEKIDKLKEKLKIAKANVALLSAAYKKVEQEKYYYKQIGDTLRKELLKCNTEKNSGLSNWEYLGPKL
jgi:hypothetical protein